MYGARCGPSSGGPGTTTAARWGGRLGLGSRDVGGRDGQGRDRTADTRIFSPLLYQLSYLAQGRAIYRYPRPAANSQPCGILGFLKSPFSLLVAASLAAFLAASTIAFFMASLA